MPPTIWSAYSLEPRRHLPIDDLLFRRFDDSIARTAAAAAAENLQPSADYKVDHHVLVLPGPLPDH